MSGLNPEAVEVSTFKRPSLEELNHDYLWRHLKALPERGRIGIFNRSYYEEVLIVRVHPAVLQAEQIPPEARTKDIWKRRYEDINNVERYLVRNGILVLKFYLHISREEQKRRLLDRIDAPDKNWKFSDDDLRERLFWSEYIDAYQDMLNHTSTEWAPWHIIPADHKWCTRAIVAEIINSKLNALRLAYPKMNKAQKGVLKKAKATLDSE
jgi:PPK2 family polyphosphate:nucleotide phosphotransferase